VPFNDDETNPSDVYSIPSYPSNARAHRAMNKARWAVEHETNEGRHKFASGTTATRDGITTWVDGSIFFTSGLVSGFVLQYYIAALGGWQNVEPHAGIPRLAALNIFGAAQYATPVVVAPSGGNIAVAANTSPYKKVTLNSSPLTLSNPTSGLVGSVTSILVEVLQDGVGGRVLNFGSVYRFPGGVAPIIATGPNEVTLLSLTQMSTNNWLVLAAADVG
jgi:hypothetical protein